jgi:hypothetical protein
MAGRARQRERSELDRLQRSSGGEKGGLEARLGGGGVRVEPARPRDRAQGGDVFRRVTPLDVVLARGSRLDPLREGFLQDVEPARRLGVVSRRVEAGERSVAYELDRRTAAASRSTPTPDRAATPTR